MNKDGYELLAVAILERAILDYRGALVRSHCCPGDKRYINRSRECESFFYSDWFKQLSSIRPDKIVLPARKQAYNKFWDIATEWTMKSEVSDDRIRLS